MNKKLARMRRAKKTRSKIKELAMPCLTVHRTPCHIYAQLVMPGGKVVVSVSTLSPNIRKQYANGGNVQVAAVVGEEIALQAKKAGISRVAFDRSGFRYHGRIQALAEAAREHGLEF